MQVQFYCCSRDTQLREVFRKDSIVSSLAGWMMVSCLHRLKLQGSTFLGRVDCTKVDGSKFHHGWFLEVHSS